MRNTVAQRHAVRLRLNATDAERLLWTRLRDKQIGGFKFRRQYPAGPYIPDFACLEAKLAIEVDGGQHGERFAEDPRRTAWLAGKGFHVLRFWNHEVLKQTEDVLTAIWNDLHAAPTPALPRNAAEGETPSGDPIVETEIPPPRLPPFTGEGWEGGN
ncbi:MAG: endonuclease domain-containing protein [Burkholderiales bacterium]